MNGRVSIVAVLTIVLIVAIAAVSVAVLSARARGRPAVPPPEPEAAVALLAPLGGIGAAPRVFAWTPVPSAASYRVTIADEDAVWPLFVRTTSGSSLPLVEKDAAAITPGRVHLWDVVALDAAGAPLARGAARFRVRMPGEKPEPGT